MANRQVLREYLARLGFDVDEQGFKDIESKLGSTLKQLTQLGKVAAVAGAALAATVTKAANDFEKLYYSAQRAGTSVKNLQSLRFAAQQIGLGADNATAALQGMAMAFRNNPGVSELFRNLGLVQVSDNTKNLINFVDRMKSMPFYLAQQLAGMFGISPEALLSMEQNNDALKQQLALRERLVRLSGMDPDKVAAASVQFTRDVGQLLESVEILGQMFAAHLLPFADATVHFLQRATEEMIKLDKVTGGWSTAIIAAASALGGIATTFGVVRGITGALGIGGAVAGAEGGGMLAGIAGFLSTVLPVILPIVITAALAYLGRNEIVKGATWLKNKATALATGAAGVAQSATDTIASFIAGHEGFRSQPYKDAGGRMTIGYGHLIKPGENFAGGITRAQGLNLLASDAGSAMATVMRNVKVALNANQVAALTDLAFNVGPRAFANSTLLKNLNAGDLAGVADQWTKWTNAGGRFSQGLYNRRLEDRDLFNKPVNVQQTTNISVSSSGESAQEIGREVSKQQQRVNGDMVRNLLQVVQ